MMLGTEPEGEPHSTALHQGPALWGGVPREAGYNLRTLPHPWIEN